MAEQVFGVGARALLQLPLRHCKQRPHQSRWILCAARDEDFDLCAVEPNDAGELAVVDSASNVPYKDFWRVLALLTLSCRKWWLVGWRIKHVLYKSEFTEALSDGRVSLPTKAKKGKPLKRSGKITLSPNCVEIDCVAGKNKVKLIDLDNYGAMPGDFGLELSRVYANDLLGWLRNFLRFADFVGLSVSRTTAAQVGWARCRKKGTCGQFAINLDAESRLLERSAYHGGRCEPFFLGDVPGIVYSLDVKSCYTDVCSRCAVPTYLLKEYRQGLPVETLEPYGDLHWIAHVVLDTDKPDYPLCWRGQTLYPTGSFHVALCWPELQHALQRGRVRHVLRAACYDAEPALRGWAQWHLESRQAIIPGPMWQFRIVLKSVFNASLGFTARRKYEWVPWETQVGRKWFFGTTVAPDYSANSVSCQILDSRAEWLRIGGEPREAMPAVHATICSHARRNLLDIFDNAGRENVLYCDTDGILVTQAGFDRLSGVPGAVGSLPGQLCERFPPGRCRIQGQKNYRVGENSVNAGLVRTRNSKLVDKPVLSTSTGRASLDGVVAPWEFVCENEGGEADRWVNWPKDLW